MLKHWIPWRLLVSQAATAYGMIDPLSLLARLRQFAQPSEVQAPIELIRAGIIFHARGLINTKAIQHNLDWIWPFWVERQFNPEDPSFIPRAYSLTHVNLTHRNWTAIGLPGLPVYPIVDPRGLITPLYDGWSLDFWIFPKTEPWLVPSRLSQVDQGWVQGPEAALQTCCSRDSQRLMTTANVEWKGHRPWLQVKVRGQTEQDGWLVVALRPYNPEGIHFIDTIRFDRKDSFWQVNGHGHVGLEIPPDKVLFSNYKQGDVANRIQEPETVHSTACSVGMGTSAALFSMKSGQPSEVGIRILLEDGNGYKTCTLRQTETWSSILKKTARLTVPDERIQALYDTAVRTLILLSAEDVVPGPYTYKRFWFRDAVFMIHALLNINLISRSKRLLEQFFSRQKLSGYFQSQDGEWDSNGQVLWIIDRFQRLTRRPIADPWVDAVLKGALWIKKKRLAGNGDSQHEGLLPAGFSAEHLGPNDYYYWDNFWGIAGLHAAARTLGRYRWKQTGRAILREALKFELRVFKSIHDTAEKSKGAIPAAPSRRMDAGAVGSLVADYPLHITRQGDSRILRTVDFLMGNCLQRGAFFQDMIHSGINVYLTLAIAQTLLRNKDDRYAALIDAAAKLASPTGQWPEAIHPITGGGCMGDGQHGWAAAEWVMMMRNLFVREEGENLILGSGIFPEWIATEKQLCFGPTRTPHGTITVKLEKHKDHVMVEWEAAWYKEPPMVHIAVPGFEEKTVHATTLSHRLGPVTS